MTFITIRELQDVMENQIGDDFLTKREVFDLMNVFKGKGQKRNIPTSPGRRRFTKGMDINYITLPFIIGTLEAARRITFDIVPNPDAQPGELANKMIFYVIENQLGYVKQLLDRDEIKQ